MSSIDYRRRLIFATMLTGHLGLQYKEDPKVTCPNTDGKTINMPPFPVFGKDIEKDDWMFSLIHECYHNKHRRDFDIIKKHKINMSTPFGMILNLLVDHNIEKAHYDDLPGADKLCKDSCEYFWDGSKLESIKEADVILQACLNMDLISRSDWLFGVDHLPTLSKEGQDKYEMIKHLQPKYNAVREDGEPNYELCCELFKALDEEQEIENASTPDSGEGEGKAGEEGEDGEGQASKAGEKGEDGEEGEGQEGVGGTVKWKPYLMDDHAEKEKPSANLDIYYAWDELDGKAIETYPLKTHKPRVCHNQYNEAPLSSNLSTRVRNLLKVYSQAKWRGGQKRGRINKRRIATIPGGNERVFKTKVNKDVLDTAVLILCDGSGSMSGSRYAHASQAGTLLGDCLGKLRIPCSINVFSTDYGTNNVTLMKRFDEYPTRAELYGRFGDTSHSMCSNSDGEFLLWGAGELAGRKEKRKVMIVLSDGQPACGNEGDVVTFTQNVAKDIEASPIELYSIGIETESVRHFYKNWRTINSSSELEGELFDLLKKALI